MDKMKVITLLSLLCLKLAVESSKPPCCYPPVFQYVLWDKIVETTSGSTAAMNITQMQVSVYSDYSTKHDARVYRAIGYDNHVLKLITDYNKEKAYFIENLGTSDENCTVSDYPFPMDRDCIPDESTLIEELFYGAGNKTLHVERYKFVNPGSDNTFYFTVQKDVCIPVEAAEIWIGMYEANTDQVSGGSVFDFQESISDPSIFTPPDHCTPGNDIQTTRSWMKSSLISLIKRATRKARN